MIRLFALLFVVLFAPVPAHADAYDDCNQLKDLERRISGCTKLLNKSRLSKKNRAIAHFNRGVAYQRSKKPDFAFKDYSAAIKHGSRNSGVYFNRALIFIRHGQTDRAIADLTKTIELDSKESSAYFERGLQYFEKLDYPRAIADFTKYIELKPKDDDGYFQRARSHRNNRQFVLARKDFDKAIALNPKSRRAREQLSFMEAKLDQIGHKDSQIGSQGADTAACSQTADLDRRIRGCTAVIQSGKLNKGNLSAAYGARGHARRKKSEHDLAILDFTEAIKLNAKNASAYLNRAISYEKTGQNEKSIQDYQKTYELARGTGPGSYAEKALARLGVSVAKGTGVVEPQPGTAVHKPGATRIQRAVNKEMERRRKELGLPKGDSDKQSAQEYLKALSEAIYTNRSQDDKASTKPNKLAKAQIENAETDFKRGVGLRKKGAFDNAIEAHTAALQRFPKTTKFRSARAEAFLDRGRARFAKEQYELAISDYTEVLKLNPRETKALNNRGISYRNKKMPDQAIADLTAAIRIKPKHHVYYYNRALAYSDKGQLDRSIADLDEALRLNPEDPSAYYNRGFVYYRKGAYDRAINDYNEALSLNPKFSKALRERGHAYTMKGDAAKAESDYDAARKISPRIVITQPDRRKSKPFKKAQQGTASNAMELAFWNDVKDSKDPNMLQAYLDQFPKGTFASLARIKLGKLKKAQ